jgi:hypothetical protein
MLSEKDRLIAALRQQLASAQSATTSLKTEAQGKETEVRDWSDGSGNPSKLEAEIASLRLELSGVPKLKSKLSSKERDLAALRELMDHEMEAKDGQITSLTAAVNDLRAKLSAVGGRGGVSTTPQALPVWDPRTPYLWNGALFPTAHDTRCSICPSIVASDPRLANVQHFFDDLMATRGRYSSTFEENPVAGFRLDRVELCRCTNLQTLFSTLEKRSPGRYADPGSGADAGGSRSGFREAGVDG